MDVVIKDMRVGNGFAYAKVYSESELIIAATIDYCIDACKERGYRITNAQEVLEWLYNNVGFKV